MFELVVRLESKLMVTKLSAALACTVAPLTGLLEVKCGTGNVVVACCCEGVGLTDSLMNMMMP